jgi:hypothetical protein
MKRFRNLTFAVLPASLAVGGIVLNLSQTGRATPTNANKSEVVVVNNVDNPVISRRDCHLSTVATDEVTRGLPI